MMIYHLLKRRALVSRETARTVAAALRSALADATQTLELDFAGVEAVSPSFVDELITELSAPSFARYRQVRFMHPPSRLSEKFRAIGRGHGISMEETPALEWIVALVPSNQQAG